MNDFYQYLLIVLGITCLVGTALLVGYLAAKWTNHD